MVNFRYWKILGILCFLVLIFIILKSREASTRADRFATKQCYAGNFPADLGNEQVDRSQAYIFPNHAITCEGQVDMWEFYASTTGTFDICVVRPENDGHLNLIGCNKITADTTGMQFYAVPESERLTVQHVDFVAIEWDNPTDPQVVSINPGYVEGRMPCQALPVQNLTESALNQLWQHDWRQAETFLWTISLRASVLDNTPLL